MAPHDLQFARPVLTRYPRAWDTISPSTPSTIIGNGLYVNTSVTHCDTVNVWAWFWFTLFLFLLLCVILVAVPFRNLIIHVIRNYVHILSQRFSFDCVFDESTELQDEIQLSEASGCHVVQEGQSEHMISLGAMERSVALWMGLTRAESVPALSGTGTDCLQSASRRYSV